MNIPSFIKNNKSTLLLVGGLIFMAGSAVASSYAGLKAAEVLREKPENEKTFSKYTIKRAGKYYILPALLFASGTACIIGADRIRKGDAVALLSAYKGVEKAYEVYKDETKKHVGKKEEKEISKKATERQIKENPPTNISFLNDETFLCYEPIGGQYFPSTKADIEKAIYNVNVQSMEWNGRVNLQDIYEQLDALDVMPEVCKYIYWDELPIEVGVDSMIHNNKPCFCLDYLTPHKVTEWR